MTGALIVAMVSLPGESWGIRCEKPDPRGFMDVTVVVPTETPLTLVLSDTKGRVISTMDLGHIWKGTHHIYMDTGRLPSGVYLLFAEGLEDYLEARVVVAR